MTLFSTRATNIINFQPDIRWEPVSCKTTIFQLDCQTWSALYLQFYKYISLTVTVVRLSILWWYKECSKCLVRDVSCCVVFCKPCGFMFNINHPVHNSIWEIYLPCHSLKSWWHSSLAGRVGHIGAGDGPKGLRTTHLAQYQLGVSVTPA